MIHGLHIHFGSVHKNIISNAPRIKYYYDSIFRFLIIFFILFLLLLLWLVAAATRSPNVIKSL